MSIKAIRRVGLAAAGVVTAGVFVFGAASLASAETAAPSPGASSGAGSHKNDGGHGADTAVTGDELAKVTAAMKAKDSAVTVTTVRKDADGSYDVLGTKDGAKVFYEASADLKTITPSTGRGGGERGHDKGTAVTGEELAKVTAAVKAKDSAVTVDKAWKGPDGAYHVLGTKDDAKVFFKVSADLKTVTQGTGKPGGRGHEEGTAVTSEELAKVTAAVKAKDSAVTVDKAWKGPDGAYHVLGTKDGAKVFFKVSGDLKTVTQDTRGPRK
ncbi:hypothetical protein [Dactylosporangium darangshiense]|uniref:PepSY domain-containing protein n=1 Tax=Dactylosporangium darangshiense TaxID=579108 RepID=A0ABP8DM70_9ACTN